MLQYYFGDVNLFRDTFLQQEMEKNGDGCIFFCLILYRVRQNKIAPSIFCDFLSNHLEFQHKILHT